MKAKLIFDLSNTEDIIEYRRVTQSISMACALFDILQLSKQCYREFESTDNLPDVFEGIDMMAVSIAEVLEKYNLNIDTLIE